MKKFFFALLVLFFITGCSNDDADEASSDLIGFWEETKFVEYIDDDENSPYEEINEPGEFIYEITERYITVHTDDPSEILAGTPIEYTYYPEEGELVIFGIMTEVKFEGRDHLTLTVMTEEGKQETYLKRLQIKKENLQMGH